LHHYNAFLDSAAVQIDAPRRITSFIRNWPASPNTGRPCVNSKAPGVGKRKLTVSTKVMMAPRLPMNEILAEKGRKSDKQGNDDLHYPD
jgi:hypothetical protein